MSLDTLQCVTDTQLLRDRSLVPQPISVHSSSDGTPGSTPLTPLSGRGVDSPGAGERRRSSVSRNLLQRKRRATSLRPLGIEYKDWHLRQFEVCPTVCEVRYVSNRTNTDSGNESKHARGFKSIGFIQDTTKVVALECIELKDTNSEKVHIWPFELTFFQQFGTTADQGRTYVIGCESMPEQHHWVKFIQKCIDDKEHMSTTRYKDWCDRQRRSA